MYIEISHTLNFNISVVVFVLILFCMYIHFVYTLFMTENNNQCYLGHWHSVQLKWFDASDTVKIKRICGVNIHNTQYTTH